MDAPAKLNDQEADRALRELFRQSGTLHAPDDLDARIMSRIAVTHVVNPATQGPLITTRGWIAACVLGALVFALALSSDGTMTDHRVADLFARLPRFDIAPLLASPWFFGSVLSAALLVVLNSWLAQRRAVARAQ